MGVDFHLGHGKRDFFERGKRSLQNAMGLFKRFFKRNFPSEKHLVLSPNKKGETSKTKNQVLGESKQNTCHKRNFLRGRVL